MNKDIKDNIHKIRETLERMKKTDFDHRTTFHTSKFRFPKGCCGDSSDLIALYLLNYHEIEITRARGEGLGDDANITHAWLVCHGYIIDITGDQFNSYGYKQPPVFINKKSLFHEEFQEFFYHKKTLKDYEHNTQIKNVLEQVLIRMRS